MASKNATATPVAPKSVHDSMLFHTPVRAPRLVCSGDEHVACAQFKRIG